MSTSVWPGGIDSFTDPSSSTPMNNATQSHSAMHTLANDAIVAIEQSRGQAGGLASLDSSGYVPAAQLGRAVQTVTAGDLTLTGGGTSTAPTLKLNLGQANTWTAKQTFGLPTGTAIDYSGALDAGNAAGSVFRGSIGLTTANGINDPARGDGLASNAANGAGASFFNGHYINFGTFSTKGSMQGLGVYGTLGANAAYGEAAGIVCSITGARAGGVLEGVEAGVIDGSGSQARASCFTGVMQENNASITYWSRGCWVTSIGSNAAGDAFYADGASGWTNFLVGVNTSGTVVAKINSAGTATFNTVLANGFYLPSDTTRQIIWGASSPNGAVTASPGSIFLNINGGAGTTLYVKESGTSTNTGWVGK